MPHIALAKNFRLCSNRFDRKLPGTVSRRRNKQVASELAPPSDASFKNKRCAGHSVAAGRGKRKDSADDYRPS